MRELIGRHPLAAARRQGSNVMLHPAALLIALVGACFFHAVQAKAGETAEGQAARAAAAADHARRAGLTLANGGAPDAATEGASPFTVTLDAVQTATLLAAIAIGLREPVRAAAPAGEGETLVPAAMVVQPSVARSDLAALPHDAALPTDHATSATAALAVVAVLHDLFRLQSAAAGPQGDAGSGGVGPTVSENLISTAPAGSTVDAGATAAPLADRALLVVHLGAGAMPHVESVAIVQSLGLFKLLSIDHVDRVDHLPDAILAAIAQGEQVDLTHSADLDGSVASAIPIDPSVVQAPGDAHNLDVGHVAPKTGGGGSTTGGGATSAASGSTSGASAPIVPLHDAQGDTGAGTAATGGSAATGVANAGPSPATPLQPTNAGSTSAASGDVYVAADSSTVKAAVLKFSADVHAGVAVSSDGTVLIYDPHVLQTLAPGEQLDAITFHFTDGSSISLVGTTTSLHDLHGVH